MAYTSEQQDSNNQEVVSAASAYRPEQADTKPHSLSPSSQNGGQTTISPPANVNPPSNSPPHILASGIDTLYLAVYLELENMEFFEILAELKKKASLQDEPQNLIIGENIDSYNWIFQVMAHGAKGYEWLIQNHEYTLKIGNWLESLQRPNVMVEIRSETLWSRGPLESVNQIIEFLEHQGATVHEIKPSRVDLCVDILLDETLWTRNLIDYSVTRSSYAAPHLSFRKLTGISIGKGNLVARLYDKPLEIKQKNNKDWMYKIWGIKSIPNGKKIIRVEFQLRRQVLNDLCVHHIYDLFGHLHNVWGYCTQKWLKFQDNPNKHHTQRHTFDWWEIVQNGFMGKQNPNPLIRQKAIEEDLNKLGDQVFGLLTSMHAILPRFNIEIDGPVHISSIIKPLMEYFNRKHDKYYNFIEDVKKKIGKLSREEQKKQEAKSDRQKNGFPYMKPIPVSKAPELEPASQPRRRRLLTDAASEKTTCHRLAGQTSTDNKLTD